MTPQAETPERVTPRISVVVVSFNRVERLRESLEALGGEHQVIVVDNGSTDGAAMLSEDFPAVRFSRLPKNFGLTKALNIGLRSAEGEYILCLHDDVVIGSEAVSRLADYLEARLDAAGVSPFLTGVSGDPIPQVRALPTPSNPDPALALPGGGEEIEVDCVSGAAIMFRSFFLRSLRQVDERYGNYGSAIEICAQMRRAGKKVVVLHSVTAIHEGGVSAMDRGALAADRANGTAVFLGKHHGFVSGIVYRVKTALAALFTLRFSILAGALAGQKIDGG